MQLPDMNFCSFPPPTLLLEFMYCTLTVTVTVTVTKFSDSIYNIYWRWEQHLGPSTVKPQSWNQTTSSLLWCGRSEQYIPNTVHYIGRVIFFVFSISYKKDKDRLPLLYSIFLIFLSFKRSLSVDKSVSITILYGNLRG
jgi:hypothetical protein